MSTINVRIDDETKTQVQGILHPLGINISQAVTMFFRQIIYHDGIPFELKIPNKTTVETFNKTNSGKDLHRVSGLDELSKELKV